MLAAYYRRRTEEGTCHCIHAFEIPSKRLLPASLAFGVPATFREISEAAHIGDVNIRKAWWISYKGPKGSAPDDDGAKDDSACASDFM